MRPSLIPWLMLAFLLMVHACLGQSPGRQQASPGPAATPAPKKKPGKIDFPQGEFTFVRIKYSSWGRGSSWATDYPDSDRNFSARFEQETGLKTVREGKVLTLTDPELKRYPFLYLAEPGALALKEAEVVALRGYLQGGGFLMVDDFWGDEEWANLRAEINRVFPGREPVELPLEHPIFHCLYDLKEKPQVPSIHRALTGRAKGITWERTDAREPHYRALFDDQQRMMALFCHNTDLADGWEREKTDPWYYEEFSLKRAYPMGINIVVYALTRPAAPR